MFTGNRDVDMVIFNHLEDRDLVNICSVSKYTNQLCHNEYFWMNRILKRFPYLDLSILKHYKEEKSWKDYYTEDLCHITSGDMMLIKNSELGRLDRVIIGVEMGANIHVWGDEPLKQASQYGHLPIVKYLIKKGADIHAREDVSLIWASECGHLAIVKYLIQQGANVHARDDGALRWASANGNLSVVKYLILQGADVSGCDYAALRWAREKKYLEVVNYLTTCLSEHFNHEDL